MTRNIRRAPAPVHPLMKMHPRPWGNKRFVCRLRKVEAVDATAAGYAFVAAGATASTIVGGRAKREILRPD